MLRVMVMARPGMLLADPGGGESRMRDTRHVFTVGSIVHTGPAARRRTK
jgi:hypothetical protein